MSRPFRFASVTLLVSTALAAAPVAFAQEPLPARKAVPLTSVEEAAFKAGNSFKECQECPEMVIVPAGRFTMGSPETEVGRTSEEGPQHKVSIAKFAVGKFEVTFAEWDVCVAEAGCKHKPNDEGWGRGRRPVIHISWNDVTQEYLPWLGRKTGKVYRLLTESEWEYVARAGSTTRFHFGNADKELCTYGNVVDLTAKEDRPSIAPPGLPPEFLIADCRDGHAKNSARWGFQAECVWPLRHARKCFGVG
jgi:formylglycine-generating enzyme required for sulfatase activity